MSTFICSMLIVGACQALVLLASSYVCMKYFPMPKIIHSNENKSKDIQPISTETAGIIDISLQITNIGNRALIMEEDYIMAPLFSLGGVAMNTGCFCWGYSGIDLPEMYTPTYSYEKSYTVNHEMIIV